MSYRRYSTTPSAPAGGYVSTLSSYLPGSGIMSICTQLPSFPLPNHGNGHVINWVIHYAKCQVLWGPPIIQPDLFNETCLPRQFLTLTVRGSTLDVRI